MSVICVDTMPIKWRLAVLMADREMDYRALAEATGMHPGTVSKLKNNLPDRLEMTTLLKLCEALNCQPGELLRYVPDNSNDRPPLVSTDSVPSTEPKTRRRTGKQSSSSPQAFAVGDCVRLPSGDRAFVDGFKDGRVLVTWEVGKMKDSFPAHLLTVVCKAA